jgi:hypothetical protein
MTVTTGAYTITSQANGSKFTYGFSNMPIYSASELLVYEMDNTTEVLTLLVEGTGSTNYAVVPTTSFNNGPSDGVITYPADSGTPRPTGKSVIMLRKQDLLQGQGFSGLGVQLPANVELGLDRIIYHLQNQQEKLDRAVTTDIGSSVDPDGFADDLADAEINAAAAASSATAAAASATAAAASAADAAANAVGTDDLLHVRDEKTSGTAGGTSTAATWHTRVLNTVLTNEITGASLASNQITLAAGTYFIQARAPSHQGSETKLRLRNITDTATELVGGSHWNNTADGQEWAMMQGRFTIAASKVFELQHYITTASASNGLGINSTTGEIEVYAEVLIELVK